MKRDTNYIVGLFALSGAVVVLAAMVGMVTLLLMGLNG